MTLTALKLVDRIWDESDHVNGRWVGKPGSEGFAAYYGNYLSPDCSAGLQFICPGCRAVCSVPFGHKKDEPWQWDKNRAAPTLKPSIIHDKAKSGCGWHGHLVQGVFRTVKA